MLQTLSLVLGIPAAIVTMLTAIKWKWVKAHTWTRIRTWAETPRADPEVLRRLDDIEAETRYLLKNTAWLGTDMRNLLQFVLLLAKRVEAESIETWSPETKDAFEFMEALLRTSPLLQEPEHVTTGAQN